MYSVYVLQCYSTGEQYTGSTCDRVQRLGQHNAGIVRSTKHARPWEIVYFEEFSTRAEAMRRERFLKSGQGREVLKAILNGKERP